MRMTGVDSSPRRQRDSWWGGERPGGGLPSASLLHRFRILAIELVLLWLALALLLVPSWPAGWVLLRTFPSSAGILCMDDGLSWSSGSMVPVSMEGTEYLISAPGYHSVDTVLSIPFSDSMVVHLDYMFPVEATSDPSGALVTLDGNPTGAVTPVVLFAGYPGAHRIGFSNERARRVETVNLLTNSVARVHCELPQAGPDGMVFIPEGWLREMLAGSDSHGHTPGVYVASFYMCDHEVTLGEFLAFLRRIDPEPVLEDTHGTGVTRCLRELSQCDFPPPIRFDGLEYALVDPGLENHPVWGVTAHAAGRYCEFYSSGLEEGWVVTLPTEEQWEHAARGGQAEAEYPWGSSPPEGGLANFSDVSDTIAQRAPDLNDGFAGTSPIGSFPPNPYGLFDMAGNLWEWCSTGEGTHVARGGSWLSDPLDCRLTSRLELDPSMGYAFVGFRPVMFERPTSAPVPLPERLEEHDP